MASDAQGISVVEMPTGALLPAKRTTPTHVAHALDAASVAARREALEVAIGEDERMYVPWSYVPILVDAVLKALGLGGDDA